MLNLVAFAATDFNQSQCILYMIVFFVFVFFYWYWYNTVNGNNLIIIRKLNFQNIASLTDRLQIEFGFQFS